MKTGKYKTGKRKLAGGGFIGSNTDVAIDAGLGMLENIPGIGGAVAGGLKLGKQLLGGLGLFGKTADQVNAEETFKRQEEIAKETARRTKTINDQAVIKTYPTNGVGVTGFYKKGGVLNAKYEVEKDEVVQGTDIQLEEGTKVASDVIKVGGAKHEDGGTEGKGGERVYSDSIKITPDLVNLLKSSGIKVSSNETYASVATKLGKMKGQFEKKNDIDNTSKTTKAKMLERIDGLMNTTFETQEASKQPTDMAQPTYRKGGTLPKYEKGKRVIGGEPMTPISTINPTSIVNSYEPSLKTTYQLNGLKPVNDISTINPNQSSTGFGEWNQEMGDKIVAKQNAEDEKPTLTGLIGKGLKSQSGNIMNVATYLMNNRTIDSIKTDIKPVLNSAPTYSYVDRSGKAKGDLNTAFNTASEGVSQASSQSTASNKAALFAERLSKLNDINQSENQRKDSYDADFNNRLTTNSNINNAIVNQNNIDNMNRANEKTAYRLNNRNSLLQGIMGNNAVLRQEKMDLLRLAIEGIKDGDRGVFDNLMENSTTAPLLKSLGIDLSKVIKKNGK